MRLPPALARPGHLRAFRATTHLSHAPAEAVLDQVHTQVLVVMGSKDPDFPDQQAEADFIVERLGGRAAMIPGAGHYPQNEFPELTTPEIVGFALEIKGGQRMPRAGLTRAVIAADAAELVDESGWDQLTLAAVAARFGVRQPSLYKHVAGLSELRRDISVLAGRELGEELATAAVGKSGQDAMVAMAEAYRTYAKKHPGRYAASVIAPTRWRHRIREGRRSAPPNGGGGARRLRADR